MAQQLQAQFHFRRVQLFKTQSLGSGSYGVVCKAMCDLLPCAAKLLHPILFQFNDPGAVTTVRRFEQECAFLNAMKHPHIVQFLGTTEDPDSGLPVLLMELMDESLTHFLERSQLPLDYHTEVSICHDIALALAYLHSNDIIHRDLSGNNVLLIAGSRAKVTDFGMSKMLDVNLQRTPLTTCPGTLVYMPPEALRDHPVYTKKIDCFSFGVLQIQVMTRRFPNPGPAVTVIEDPRSPVGTIHIPNPDRERRKSHIDLIESTHPLLQTALSCLSYTEEERPSVEELCSHLATLKLAPRYIQSMQQRDQRVESATTDDTEDLLRELREQNREQTHENQELLEQLEAGLAQIQNLQEEVQEREAAMTISQRDNDQLRQELEQANQYVEEKQHAIDARDRQLQQLDRALQANDRAIAEFQRNLSEKQAVISNLQEIISGKETEIQDLHHHQSLREQPHQQTSNMAAGTVELGWRECRRAPETMYRGAAVSDGAMAYFSGFGSPQVHAYNSENEEWTRLPDCPQTDFSLVVLKGLLTSVGGKLRGERTSFLLSLTGEDTDKKWSQHYPSMPSGCSYPATVTVCNGRFLVTAGGYSDDTLGSVNVLDTESLKWSTASNLPHPFYYATAAVSEDRLYLLGGIDLLGGIHQNGYLTLAVLSCSISDLLQSCQPQDGLRTQSRQLTVWHRIADAPLYGSTCVTLCGQLLAVGGGDAVGKMTATIHAYNPKTDSWRAISDMPTARWRALAAGLPGNSLIVVGGGSGLDNVEIATII